MFGVPKFSPRLILVALVAALFPAASARAAEPADVYPPTHAGDAVLVDFRSEVRQVSTSNVRIRLRGPYPDNLPAWLECFFEDEPVLCDEGPVTWAALQPSQPLTPGVMYDIRVNPEDGGPLIVDATGAPIPRVILEYRPQVEPESSVAARFAWGRISDSRAYGGSYVTERLGGAARYGFNGPTVTWLTMKGPDQGVASVYVDGRYKAGYNLFQSSRSWRVPVTLSGLGAGSHVLTIVPRNQKGAPSATGSFVSIDAFRIGPSLTSTPVLDYSWQAINDSRVTDERYVRADSAGANASFTFIGHEVGVAVLAGPSMGKAAIYLNDSHRASIDLYAATFRPVMLSYMTGGGKHTIKIAALGQKRAASKGAVVAVDGWIVDPDSLQAHG